MILINLLKKYSSKFFTAIILAGLLFSSGCSTPEPGVYVEDERSMYRSYAGSDIVREQVKEGFESIKRLHNSVIYRTYQLDPARNLTESDIPGVNLEQIAVRAFNEDHSTAGTGIIISNRMGRTAMLTASHTVSFPDTIWHYDRSTSQSAESRLEAVSVKTSGTHFLFGEGRLITFKVALNDERRDLAILTMDWGGEGNPGLKPLDIPPGNHEKLDWTDMVYALGYPRGVQMVTKGMVSQFSVSPRRSFVVDASFNRGFSGGPIFSVRNDGSGLEWVGTLSAAYAENEYFLSPGAIDERDFHPDREYAGPAFVRREARINYGITYAVGMEEISAFFEENSRELRRLGITTPRFP
ncbi:MAG: serine protease [Balneolaceae bacterium]|nr:MAG: serine protease [Balneolaceae bacterium]